MNNNENKEQNNLNKKYSNSVNCNNNKELQSYLLTINNILNTISSLDDIKTIKKEINLTLNNLKKLFEKITKEKELYESLLKKEENIIRKLYSDLLHENILKEVLEEKIIAFLKMQSDYELIKEKTGVIVCNGKIVTDGRKDNEIAILRTENSTLKNVINEKEKEIEKLKSESEKSKIKNNMLIPNYSQKDFTINNNFSSTARNFYKSYKIQTKLLNSKKNNNNKTIERNTTNNFINSKDNNTIIPEEKIISVNKSRFTYNNKKITSRNNGINNLPSNNNYASCENILNKSKIKTKKKVNKSKVFYPMREFNSVRFINTQSNANKENIDNNCVNSNNIKNQKKNVILKNKKDDKFRTYYGGFGLGNKK